MKRHLSVSFQIVPGLDFMIGGKDTCDVRKILPVKFFGLKVLLFASQGDSGGPLWVREDEGGDLPNAYLV